MPIRTVLVDDHQMVLDGLAAMLLPHVERVLVVGRATTGAEALACVAATDPDVVLCDVRLKGESGFDVCERLVRAGSRCKVVFLTVYDDEQYLFQALRGGAAGYLLKRVEAAELVEHLESVMAGEIVVDPALAGRLALSATKLRKGEFWPGSRMGLSQRESEVLACMVGGLSNRAIAQHLVVSEETVKSHVSVVLRKLDVRDRTAAVAVALRDGIFR